MRIFVVAVAAFIVLACGSANAQSLENTYADLCADSAAAKSESCVALSKALVAKLQGQAPGGTSTGAWGVLSHLAGKKFVWNSGRARGSHEKELTFHEFYWSGQVLKQTQCSYWPQKTLRPACGTNVIELASDGGLILKANGGKPHFKGSISSNGSVEFVNKTLLGKFVTAFVMQPDGSVALTHGNWVDGASSAPMIPIDAAGEAQVMAELESVHHLIQEQKQVEGDRRYAALMGSMQALNAVLSEVQQNNSHTGGYAEAQANLDATVANINAAAAVERQQQALAAQQEQARAAEANRQQLAENARWVAEKEQAAAEYRSGQTEVAAAREAQLREQQQASEQRRAAAEVQRRSAEQTATIERQRAQASALAEREQLVARPVVTGQATTSGAPAYQLAQTAPSPHPQSGPIEMHVFFINLGGKTVAFEGPLGMTRAEGKAMKARLAGEAPSKYGAGAVVDARSRPSGYCAFVYQEPGNAFYTMGSGNSLSAAIESKDGQEKNSKSVIHTPVVCPDNT